MDNKINFYGYEIGVLLEKSDEEFDFYSQNNKSLDYGFYNEDNGFFLEKDYKENLKYIRNYVEDGVNGTYGIISFQGRIKIVGEEYDNISKGEYSLEDMNFDFFKDLAGIEYSICKKDGRIIEYFLEDEIKKTMAKKIEKDISINELNVVDRVKYALKPKGITTLNKILKTPLKEIESIDKLGQRSFSSIRSELNRICHKMMFEKELKLSDVMDKLDGYSTETVDYDKELILQGIEKGIVTFISSPNDGCIVCKIGEYWFYFIGSEYEHLEPDEVLETFTKDELAEMVFNAISNSIDENERYYYISVLHEMKIEEKSKVPPFDSKHYGKIIQDMVKVAKASDNHTWFLEVDEFLDGTYTQEDLNELYRDLHSIKESGIDNIDSIVEMCDSWKEAEEWNKPVATFHGAYLDLFQQENVQRIDEELELDDLEK
ncbi:hypothetical protein MKC55_20505 [[Clostridium] innocuum]|nr:hypothetical protein [[Clostridium] innocuum]